MERGTDVGMLCETQTEDSTTIIGGDVDTDEDNLIVAAETETSAVIDELENEKMEVLNANASTATLNMQNFVSAEYQHRKDEIVITDSGDGTFECKDVLELYHKSYTYLHGTF